MPMKKLMLIPGLIFFTSLLFAQSKIDSLVQIGIGYHDRGQYPQAIELYQQALALDPNSALVHYEIALTYLYAKDYHHALLHCDKVIELNDQYLVPAYVTKGSCLDYMGRTEESIKVFEKGLKQFGPNYLLYYNLGYDYYKLKEYDKARETFTQAILSKSNHTSSHLLLGYVMADVNQKVQSLLSLHYFLLLEPDTERAKTAYNLLQSQFGGNVTKEEGKPNQINISFDPKQSGTEFGAADLMVSMLAASNSLEENKDKTREELFIANTTSFFTVLGELKKKKNKGLWWDFYIPFYYDLAKSEHMDTYCYYISTSSNPNANVWLANNPDKIDSFNNWLKGR